MTRPSSANIWNVFLLIVLTGLLVWRFWPALSGTGIDPAQDANAPPRIVAARGDLAEDEKSTINLFKEASVSVVNVTTIIGRRFSFNMTQDTTGTGSGFVWDEEGHIVTNYHVVKGATTIQVTLADHSVLNVEQVHFDPDNDIAVLWTDGASKLPPPLPLGESSKLQVGQKAFAIGNPFGLDQTLTTGIISALGREIQSPSHETIKGVIQTDAAINPGNSGGPLLDSAGRLIGVNTAIYSPTGASAGIGFAIPIDEINRVVPRLIRMKQALHPSLGIEEAPDSLVQSLAKRKIPVRGVLVLNVTPGGAAEKAGLRPTTRDNLGRIHFGDMIVAVDDQPVHNANELYAVIEKCEIGQVVRLRVSRDGKEIEVAVTLNGASQ